MIEGGKQLRESEDSEERNYQNSRKTRVAGAHIQQWDCWGGANQQVDIIHTADGWHEIKFRHSGKCLDVTNWSTADGTHLQQWACAGTDNQKWSVPACAGCLGAIVSKFNGKCVDVDISSGDYPGNGKPVMQWTCHGGRNQQWMLDSHTLEKSIFTDRWYQRFEDIGSYVTWMTLTSHRHYASSGFATAWATPTTNAIAAYNAASFPTTVYFAEYAPADWHDVHVVVTNRLYSDAGVNLDTLNNLGITYFFDEVKHSCGPPGSAPDCDAQHSRPNTWWYVFPMADNDQHSGFYGNAFQRQATVAHELGHAVVLAHDGIGDGQCGTGAIPRTVMDFDCLDNSVLNTPQNWDACGINHVHYDPNRGLGGC